jgi:hypothetical protein
VLVSVFVEGVDVAPPASVLGGAVVELAGLVLDVLERESVE